MTAVKGIDRGADRKCYALLVGGDIALVGNPTDRACLVWFVVPQAGRSICPFFTDAPIYDIQPIPPVIPFTGANATPLVS